MGAVSDLEKYLESFIKDTNRTPDWFEMRIDFWQKFAKEQKEKGIDAYHYRHIPIKPKKNYKMNENFVGKVKFQ